MTSTMGFRPLARRNRRFFRLPSRLDGMYALRISLLVSLVTAERAHELLLPSPADPPLGGNRNLATLAIAAAPAREAPGVDLEPERAVRAEDPHLARRRERCHRAEAEIGDGAADQRGQDVDVIRDPHVVPGAAYVAAPRDSGLRHRHHPACRRQPPRQRLVPDAHAHDVEAADRGVLTPVQRLGGVDEAPLDRPDLDRQHLADVALRHQLDAGLRPEFRDVMFTRVGACAHESYADRLVDHGTAW